MCSASDWVGVTRRLSLAEILRLHELIIASSGGSSGLRDLGALESALGQPHLTFAGEDLYPGVGSESGSPRLLFDHEPPPRRWKQASRACRP